MLWIQIVLFVLQIGLLWVLFVFIYKFLARALSALTDVPFVPTDYAFLPPIVEALDIRPRDVVYDLGCGDARLLFYCAKRYPDARFVGIERNSLLVMFARIKKKMLGVENLEIRQENLYDADFTDATRLYTFLLPEVMTDIAPKLTAPHIVSRAFVIPDRQPKKEFWLSDMPDSAWNTHAVYVYY